MTSREKRKAKQAAAKPSKAIIYLRVSTAKQAASGAGVEAQRSKCVDYCRQHGLEIVSEHLDNGLSGKNDVASRPGLQGAIEALRANPGAVLVVYSLSRLGRSQRMIWTLLDDRGDYALPLVSATEPFDVASPMGRAMLGMLGTFAQLESDLASERTIAALEEVYARGTKLGAPSMIEAIGPDGKRTVDRTKLALVRQVQELYETGDYSHKTLADHLNATGIPSVSGRRWHPRTVRVALNTKVAA